MTPRPFVIRKSAIAGKGAFATRRIPKGARIVEYTGERISQDEADRRYPYDPEVPHHTFLFNLEDDVVVDAAHRGNASRFINHSCEPNCEAVIEDGRIWIYALKAIPEGTELVYDYRFILDEPHTPAAKRRYPCRCGARRCRGTILAKKR
jgi:SET domain-containing protein